MVTFDPHPAAAIIVDNRRTARSSLPSMADRPVTIEDAYAVQDLAFAQLGTPGGWKVSPGKDGADPTLAPLLSILASGATVSVPASLPIRIEVEIAFRFPEAFADGLPDAQTFADRIELVPLFEVMKVDVPKDQNPTPFDVVAAGAYNHAVVIGTPAKRWQHTDWSALSIALGIDGALFYVVDGVPDAKALVALAYWTLDHLLAKGTPIPAGAIVTTGALKGATVIPKDAIASANFGPFGTIDMRIVATD